MDDWIQLADARTAVAEGTGQGVKIAVIDSGIDTSHKKLKELQLLDDIAIVEDGVKLNVENGGGDVYGHGTAVAGIIHK